MASDDRKRPRIREQGTDGRRSRSTGRQRSEASPEQQVRAYKSLWNRLELYVAVLGIVVLLVYAGLQAVFPGPVAGFEAWISGLLSGL